MTEDDDTQAAVARVEALVNRIKPMLAGQGSEVQGGALADLLAMWLAGHPDFVREELLAAHTACARNLVTVNEDWLFGPNGHPQNNGKGTRQ